MLYHLDFCVFFLHFLFGARTFLVDSHRVRTYYHRTVVE